MFCVGSIRYLTEPGPEKESIQQPRRTLKMPENDMRGPTDDRNQGLLGDELVAAPEVESTTDEVVVFVGIRITWRKRISDLELNTGLASEWENQFAFWDIGDRAVTLADAVRQYRVRLSDGEATFFLDGWGFVESALPHITTYVSALRANDRERISLTLVLQLLQPIDGIAFDDLVKHLAATVYNEAFIDPATMIDINYLADAWHDGLHYQLNIGPVREHELDRRVYAEKVLHRPDRAIFLSVTSRQSLMDQAEPDIRGSVNAIRDIGQSAMERVMP